MLATKVISLEAIMNQVNLAIWIMNIKVLQNIINL